MRMITLAEYAAGLVGYGNCVAVYLIVMMIFSLSLYCYSDLYIKAFKLFATGGGLMAILMQNNYVAMMYPLMELLKDFGITGPNG